MLFVNWLSIKKNENPETKEIDYTVTLRAICDIKKQSFEIARTINKIKRVLKDSKTITWKIIKQRETKKEIKYILDFDVMVDNQEYAFIITDKLKQIENILLDQKTIRDVV